MREGKKIGSDKRFWRFNVKAQDGKDEAVLRDVYRLIPEADRCGEVDFVGCWSMSCEMA